MWVIVFLHQCFHFLTAKIDTHVCWLRRPCKLLGAHNKQKKHPRVCACAHKCLFALRKEDSGKGRSLVYLSHLGRDLNLAMKLMYAFYCFCILFLKTCCLTLYITVTQFPRADSLVWVDWLSKRGRGCEVYIVNENFGLTSQRGWITLVLH